jgi:Fe-S-cluster containining protein
VDSPCAGCDGRCCVGRSVALGAADVRRLQAALGLPWSAFAAVVSDEDGFWLEAGGPRYGFRLRHAGDGSCVFAVTLDQTRRCGVHGARPLSCRVYPWHVALADDQAADARIERHAGGAGPAHPQNRSDDPAEPRPLVAHIALGHDAACPPPLADAWRARLDDERAALAAAVAASNDEADRRARWNDAVIRSGRRHVVDDYLGWTAP